jgi:hypothetical protein
VERVGLGPVRAQVRLAECQSLLEPRSRFAVVREVRANASESLEPRPVHPAVVVTDPDHARPFPSTGDTVFLLDMCSYHRIHFVPMRQIRFSHPSNVIFLEERR